MALSNTPIQKAKRKAKNYRLYDERGLHLETHLPGGGAGASNTVLGAKRNALR